MARRPVLITSVPPKVILGGLDADPREARIRAAIGSYVSNGYDVVSLRRGSEAGQEWDVSGVRHASGSNDGFFPHRYGPSFADLFRCASSQPVAAVANSDTYLVPCDIADYMLRQRRTVVASRRMDVDGLGGAFEGVYGRGIDALFFSPDIDLERFAAEDFASFQLGAPFWDIVVPLVLSFHFDVKFASPPLLLHPIHEANWRREDYRSLREHAVRIVVDYARRVEADSPRSAQFLEGLKLYCPAFGTASLASTAKKAATYMAFFLEGIEATCAASPSMDLNDPYMRACVISMTGADRDHINAARLMARYYSSNYRVPEVLWYFIRLILRTRRVLLRRRRMHQIFGTSAMMPGSDNAPSAMAGIQRRPLIRVRLKHDLWTPEQHRPHELKIPSHYRSAKHPSKGQNFAIVTPSFNHAAFLRATVASVLSQEIEGLSYHVQDGASSDGSVDTLKSMNGHISYASNPDNGQSHAINLGFAAVSGDIMAYLNSDDILLPGSLGYVRDFFDRNPDVDFVYSHRIFVNADGKEIGRAVLPPHDDVTLKWADYVPQETMFWRRSVWDAVGPFDETLRFAMDWDFLLRAQNKGFRFARLPRFLGAFRVHEQQKTLSSIDIGQSEMGMLRHRWLGFRPTPKQIDDAIRSYLNRQAVFSFLSRRGLLKF